MRGPRPINHAEPSACSASIALPYLRESLPCPATPQPRNVERGLARSQPPQDDDCACPIGQDHHAGLAGTRRWAGQAAEFCSWYDLRQRGTTHGRDRERQAGPPVCGSRDHPVRTARAGLCTLCAGPVRTRRTRPVSPGSTDRRATRRGLPERPRNDPPSGAGAQGRLPTSTTIP